MFIPYTPFSLCPSLVDCPIIYRFQIQELDWLAPGVDLVSYAGQDFVFKFNPIGKPMPHDRAWKEINLLSKLPHHPNILPLSHVVLEDMESRVIGFTTRYIPGGTLHKTNPKQLFRFEWLQQLTQVVDFLNFELGIMHQDIAPRNLLIDSKEKKIFLFDFNIAANGKDSMMTADWTCRRELDSDVSKFREFLDSWIAMRSDRVMERYLDAPIQLAWPPRPIPPEYSEPGPYGGQRDWRTVREALKLGQYCYSWTRLPQSKLLEEDQEDAKEEAKKKAESHSDSLGTSNPY
ncbi:hypothetical protein N7495_001723 [Penicillium taxi]|uniref:uncharacterized protein n=1 Tax=Penicillium taxi TaxID=168475 RepID=UPI0025452C67|nr:uncharacterized protein N7495_001723 [Penicillium taxi]KAJ5909041.1 hypothetical protein N7495_001723 [Penicillium taxi]